ncbi:MAG TPA: hypothetical protein VLE95_08930 [Chlamydiales bacterium]|nr:hypothetical protein [Chlamydiales bacterium]
MKTKQEERKVALEGVLEDGTRLRAVEGPGGGLIGEAFDEESGTWGPVPPAWGLNWGDMFRAFVGPF